MQEAGIKIIPKEEKCKKTKQWSEEALQIGEEGREAKGQGERHTQPNAVSETSKER